MAIPSCLRLQFAPLFIRRNGHVCVFYLLSHGAPTDLPVPTFHILLHHIREVYDVHVFYLCTEGETQERTLWAPGGTYRKRKEALTAARWTPASAQAHLGVCSLHDNTRR